MNANRGALVAMLGLALLGLIVSSTGARATPPQASGRIYADDQLWATFVTTPLPPGPSNSFDQLYHFPGTSLIPLSNAGPGNPDYKGGRWMVFNVAFTGMAPTQFTDRSEEHTSELQSPLN